MKVLFFIMISLLTLISTISFEKTSYAGGCHYMNCGSPPCPPGYTGPGPYCTIPSFPKTPVPGGACFSTTTGWTVSALDINGTSPNCPY